MNRFYFLNKLDHNNFAFINYYLIVKILYSSVFTLFAHFYTFRDKICFIFLLFRLLVCVQVGMTCGPRCPGISQLTNRGQLLVVGME